MSGSNDEDLPSRQTTGSTPVFESAFKDFHVRTEQLSAIDSLRVAIADELR
ncbi:MAG: hypothetical protein ACKOQX_02985 [Actinomycetota bacterium]